MTYFDEYLSGRVYNVDDQGNAQTGTNKYLEWLGDNWGKVLGGALAAGLLYYIFKKDDDTGPTEKKENLEVTNGNSIWDSLYNLEAELGRIMTPFADFAEKMTGREVQYSTSWYNKYEKNDVVVKDDGSVEVTSSFKTSEEVMRNDGLKNDQTAPDDADINKQLEAAANLLNQ